MTIQIKFRGIDSWNRPVFRGIDEKYKFLYFGDVNKLWSYEADTDRITEYYKEHIEALEYFGDHFDCEPHGGMPFKGLELKII
jgi:hypothetical protein